MSIGALRVSMRSPYCFTASDKDGAGSDAPAPAGLLAAPGRLERSSGAKVRRKSYWPSMPVSSTRGLLVKRVVTPTSVNRLAFGAVIVTADVVQPKMATGLGLPS